MLQRYDTFRDERGTIISPPEEPVTDPGRHEVVLSGTVDDAQIIVEALTLLKKEERMRSAFGMPPQTPYSVERITEVLKGASTAEIVEPIDTSLFGKEVAD